MRPGRQAHPGRPRFAPGEKPGKRGDVLRESARGSGQGMLSACTTPEAQKRGQRRGKRGGGGRGGAARGCHRRRGGDRSRSGLPHPALGPSHSHAGPAPLGLLPPRGQQPPGEKEKPRTSCFRRATRKRLPNYRTGAAARLESLLLHCPASPNAERTTSDARGHSREIWRAGFSLPLAFSSSSSVLCGCTDTD